MSEPMVSYPLVAVLERIEKKIDRVGDRVGTLESKAATATAVRRALWAAAASPGVAALVGWLVSRH